MKLRANCKINIGLDVLRRRADGFHDVSTVMVPVRELYDRLEIEPAIETELVQLGLPVDCPPEDNICLRAWRLMHERYGAGPVRIVLDKRVPYGAGLGGGSADATAVVQGVDALFGLRLAEAERLRGGTGQRYGLFRAQRSSALHGPRRGDAAREAGFRRIYAADREAR